MKIITQRSIALFHSNMPNIPINAKSIVIPALPINIKVFLPNLKLKPKPTRVAAKFTEQITAVISSGSNPS